MILPCGFINRCGSYLILVLLMFAGDGMVLAQSIIKGRVIDKSDKKPLAYVNVFLSNATVGAQTAADGTFTLKGIRPGTYDLVVSMVGFDTYSQSITLSDGAYVNLPDIEIGAKIVSLREVVIKPHDDPDRDKYIQMFKEEFLGTTELAEDCILENPDVLDFEYNEQAGELKASSTDFLIVQNRALGYRVKYLLTDFYLKRVNKLTTVHFFGSVLFEKMQGAEGQRRQWTRRRLDVYAGSEMHFLRSILSGRETDEGFMILQYATCQNLERPADSVIKSKIAYYTKLSDDKAGKGKWKDSIALWKKKEKLPSTLKKLINFPLERGDILSKTDREGIYALGCDFDGLFIQYNKNHHFANNMSDLSSRFNYDSTLVGFALPFTFFDTNGWVLNPASRSFSGAWGKYRVAGMLPADYEPTGN